jgi:hypothetical protein
LVAVVVVAAGVEYIAVALVVPVVLDCKELLDTNHLEIFEFNDKFIETL